MIITTSENEQPPVPPVVEDVYDVQAHLGDSGIVLNGTTLVLDDFGVEWGWFGDDPWGPSPNVRVQAGARAGDHGDYELGDGYLEARQWTLEGEVLAPSDLLLHQARERLKVAIAGRLAAFRVLEPGFDRWTLVRRAGDLLWTEEVPGRARFSVALKAPDPRLYSTTPRTLSAPLPSTGSSFAVPLSVPFGIGASSVARDAVNAGTETAWPVWRLVGPMVNPVIVNAVTGQSFGLRNQDGSSFAVGAGETLVIDTAPSVETVLLATSDEPDGDWNLSRKFAFQGEFWGFGPGTTRVEMSASSPTALGADQFFATYRDVWL